MLCGVKVKSEEMSLESFAEDGEGFHCPDTGPEFVPPLRCQHNRLELDAGHNRKPVEVMEKGGHIRHQGLCPGSSPLMKAIP